VYGLDIILCSSAFLSILLAIVLSVFFFDLWLIITNLVYSVLFYELVFCLRCLYRMVYTYVQRTIHYKRLVHGIDISKYNVVQTIVVTVILLCPLSRGTDWMLDAEI